MPRPTTAYTDASLIEAGVYALAALLGDATVVTVARARTTQHAELLAARLAAQHAPPGPLHLHVDCRATARALTTPRAGPDGDDARAVLTLARTRGVHLTVTWIPRAENAAHPAARGLTRRVHTRRRTRRQVLRHLPGPDRTGPVLHVRRTPRGATAHGAGLRAHADGPLAALRVLITVAPLVPPGDVRVRGVPPYAAHLWRAPRDAPPDLIGPLRAAHATLDARRARLHLETR